MPHLASLVERHKDDPFTLIGINTGDDPDAYHEGVENFGVVWPVIFQGTTPFISKLYSVSGYPTYLLIDKDGKIVSRAHGAPSDGRIAKLIEEAKAARGK